MSNASFKTFMVESVLNEQKTYISEGIAHIEDLPIEDFLFAVENFNKMIATQKLDGANLRVGFDGEGRFYTSRESKGGKRFYKISDYPDDFIAYEGFKSAHQALEKKKGEIKEVIGAGSACEIEVLFQRQPNAITYGKDGLNYIAFLRMLVTPNDETPDQKKIKLLNDKLENDLITVNSYVTDTDDGENLTTTEEVVKWKFITPEKVPSKDLKSVNLKKEISALKKFLNEPNKKAIKLTDGEVKTNYDVMSMRRKELTDEREKVKDLVQNNYKLSIKDTLLRNFIRNMKPSIQDSNLDPDEDLGIEGVVFLDPVTQKQFKIVDKDIFTTINSFNFVVRSNISGNIRSADPLTTLANRGGIAGDARIRMISLFGITGLSTTLNVKRTLKKFGGDSPEELVVNMAKSLKQVNMQATKKKMEAILISTIEQLGEALDDFKENSDKYKQKLTTGKTVGYTKEVKRRTLLTFAETKRSLTELLAQVKKSKNIADLIVAMFGKQIKDIFTGKNNDE